MVRIFEKTSKTKYQSKKRPNTLLTSIPAQVRDYLELEHKSTLKWIGYIDDTGKKCVKIYKEQE